jgi:bifunctional DNA-binding transcriptional regulator/antitoxin component of YhaV-PrlF toxin-antitoxin module
MEGFEVEVEVRRKLGLPSEALAAAGWRPGDRVQIQARPDGRLVIVPMVDLVDKFVGAIPGLSAATDLTELRAP